MPDCLQAALEYAKRGLKVFPVHVVHNGSCSCGKNCPSPGKHPRTKNGVRDATIDEATIRKWWQRWPDSNVAVALAESKLIDVECDSPEAEADYVILIGDDPPVCPCFQSHRGKHRLFGSRPDIPKGKQAGRVEVRGTSPNLYSLFPPSLHPSGDTYRWLVPLAEFDELPPLPSAVITTMINLAGEPLQHPGKEKRSPEHWKQGFKGVGPGGRTDFAISYIGKMLRELPSLEDGDLVQFVLDAALAINEQNKPPLPPEKLQKDFEGILKRERQRRLNIEVAEAIGIELSESGELPEGFAFYKVCSDPPRYEWQAPIFKKAENGRVVFTGAQFLSGRDVQKLVFQQADVFLTASFVKQWGKQSQSKDGHWRPSIAERLVENMRYEDAPPEEVRWRVVADLLFESLEKARPVEEGQALDAKGRPCRTAEGIVFKVKSVWRDINFDPLNQVSLRELSALLQRMGATEFQSKEARGQRFKLLNPQALTQLKAAAEGG